MKTAWLYLRHKTDRRYKIFTTGLKRHGYKIVDNLPYNWGDDDIFITWNRLHAANKIAKEFQRRGQQVLVAENASWGNDFAGQQWFHIARNYHNTADCFDYLGPERWDNLNIELKFWRETGETVILPQRGIGSPPTRMPGGWPQEAKQRYDGRIRRHPGKHPGIPLEEDLKKCGRVITWGSGAAIKALILGCKVISEMPNWLGEQDNADNSRLEMFRRLAWAQWSHEDIESGFSFERLLAASPRKVG